jgi:CBS domain-containing protein
MQSKPITDIMTRDVQTVHTGQRLSDVRRLIVDLPIHQVPVVDDGRLVGMISTNDMVRVTFEAFGRDDRSLDMILDSTYTVDEIMNRELITIEHTATIRDAARVLSTGSFHCLPIVSEGQHLEGLITSTDLIRYLAELPG